MRYNTVFFIFSSLIPLVASTYAKSGPSSCKNTEFWWNDKKCCLPHGGIPSPPPPPKGSYCPPAGYYWSNQQGCCVPHYPPPDHGPEPQCPKDCKWYSALYKCLPLPKPTPTHPVPKPSAKPTVPCHGKGASGKYGDGKCEDKKDDSKNHDGGGYSKDHDDKDGKDSGSKGGNGRGGNRYRKRSVRMSRLSFCPVGLEACPIPGFTGGEYECLDTSVELESCGGCASENKGQNCNAIQGAWNVGCEEGRCVVYTCAGGFQPSYDRQSCIPL